jgi:hypothetical protein
MRQVVAAVACFSGVLRRASVVAEWELILHSLLLHIV